MQTWQGLTEHSPGADEAGVSPFPVHMSGADAAESHLGCHLDAQRACVLRNDATRQRVTGQRCKKVGCSRRKVPFDDDDCANEPNPSVHQRPFDGMPRWRADIQRSGGADANAEEAQPTDRKAEGGGAAAPGR